MIPAVRLSFFFPLLASAAFLSACVGSEVNLNETLAQTPQAVMGGVEVSEESLEARSVVMISSNSDGFVCTGTLVSYDLVLTAAHCIGSDPLNTTVSFGPKPFENLSLDERKVIAYRKHELHRDPRFEERNDVALIQFEGRAPEHMTFARLPRPHQKIQAGMPFVALGYGRTDGQLNRFQRDDGTGVLRKVDLRMRDWRIDGLEFTADQSGGKGVCVGDSGGPALIWDGDGNPVVLGVASGVYYEEMMDASGPDFDRCQGLSLYVETSSYLEWIIRSMLELRYQKRP